MVIIHRIGTPENDSEARAIKRLGNDLPKDFFVFHNFDVAPAVWQNPSDVVPASDVYSLGLVFYQLITGQPPRHDVEAVLAGAGLAIDTELLAEELSRSDSPNFMSDPQGAARSSRGCVRRSDPIATQRWPKRWTIWPSLKPDRPSGAATYFRWNRIASLQERKASSRKLLARKPRMPPMTEAETPAMATLP